MALPAAANNEPRQRYETLSKQGRARPPPDGCGQGNQAQKVSGLRNRGAWNQSSRRRAR
jgi:hypothetical protein